MFSDYCPLPDLFVEFLIQMQAGCLL
ncbi:uncharacterized protein METZ01_LOCUS377588, partial [marine metagenome]